MPVIDGNAVARTLLDALSREIKQLGATPGLSLIRVGEDPASRVYVNKKVQVAEAVGIRSQVHVFPESCPEKQLLGWIEDLNADPSTHGILVQAPLPAHIQSRTVFNSVHPDKDVDGFSVLNLGRLVQEDPAGFVACTPAGILELIRHCGIPTQGAHVVVVGRSLIVGKPAGLLFLRKGLEADSTVTFCHSRTRDLGSITRQADILIAAVGRASSINGSMVKQGATVIDVGINRIEDSKAKRGYRLVGDVDFENTAPVAGWITPVPGGVGPLTVAMLMKNTLKAWKQQNGLSAGS